MLHLLIPAYNEADQIEPLFKSISELMQSESLLFHIYLVDDGSSDATARIARGYSCSLPLTVISHETNKGVSAAFRTGFDEILSKCEASDLVITMEANKNADPFLIPELLKVHNAGSDVVLASCYAPGGAVIGDPFFRLFLSKTINWILKLLFPCNGVHTYTSFYRLWNPSVLCSLRDNTGGLYFKQDGFVCMADMLIKSRKIPGIQIAEVPLILKSDIHESGSKMKIGKTICGYLDLIRSNLFK